MTIPFSVPDVKPLYLDTSRVQPNAFHERLKTFLGVLQQREDNAIRERELRNQELAKMEQAQAGALLGQMVQNMDTTRVPGMTVPTDLPGGPGPSMTLAPQTFEGPLAKAMRSQPGAVIYEALGRGNNLVTQYFNDKDKALNARAKAPPKPTINQIVDRDGFALAWDEAKGTASRIIDTTTGLPVRVRVPDTGAGSEHRWQLTGYEQNGVPIEYDGVTGQMRPVRGATNLFKNGPVTESENRFAMLYTESAEAWKTLKATGYKALPKGFVDFVAGARKAIGEDGPFESYLTSSAVFDEPTKQAIMAYAVIGMNNIYGKSGAAITVKEMQGILSRLPTDYDNPTTKAAKTRFFRRGIESQFRSGYNALRRGEVEAQVPYQRPYELFMDAPGTDPQSGQTWTPGNPYGAPQGSTPPFSLQRPR